MRKEAWKGEQGGEGMALLTKWHLNGGLKEVMRDTGGTVGWGGRNIPGRGLASAKALAAGVAGRLV